MFSLADPSWLNITNFCFHKYLIDDGQNLTIKLNRMAPFKKQILDKNSNKSLL